MECSTSKERYTVFLFSCDANIKETGSVTDHNKLITIMANKYLNIFKGIVDTESV